MMRQHPIGRCIVAAFVIAVLAASQAPADMLGGPAIVGHEYTGCWIAGGTGTVGWRFTVSSPIEVTALGYYDMDADGLGGPHLIGIWSDAGDLLAGVEVSSGTDCPLVGEYRYVGVEGLFLETGQVYVTGTTLSPISPLPQIIPFPDDITVWDIGSEDIFPALLGTGSVLMDSRISVLQPGVFFHSDAPYDGPISGFFGFPQEESTGSYLGPNFLFVPEPMTLTLLTLGGLGVVLRRRRRGRGTAPVVLHPRSRHLREGS